MDSGSHISTVPINSGTFNPDFCNINNEYLVRSNVGDEDLLPVYGLNQKDDLAVYSIQFKDFGMTDTSQLGMDWSCISEDQSAVITADMDDTRTKKKLIVVAGGHGRHQSKRFTNFVQNIDALQIDSYSWDMNEGNLIHVIKTPQQTWEYLVTYKVPVIELTGKGASPDQPIKTSVDLKFTSAVGDKSFVLTQEVEIKANGGNDESQLIVMDI